MRILVIGSGAREHALAWKLHADSASHDLVSVPGNPGIGRVARLASGDPADARAMLAIVDRERIDLTIVGPELPLERGIVDTFREAGRPIVGPTRDAARLETSKVFAKDFMARHRIPTARYVTCTSAEAARETLRDGRFEFPVVLKADGLAAGKGVVVAPDAQTAEAAVRAVMVDRQFGAAGARLVIEEFMHGIEASFFVVCDGRVALPLMSAQDHKRVFDNDEGPNTGGMGAFAPSPLVDATLADRVMREIVRPVLDGLRAEGCDYTGFLYVGLMLTSEGPRVVEFNVRFGDPEAQVVLPTIESPLADLLMKSATGALAGETVRFSQKPHVGVVLASRGYPATSESGRAIDGLAAAERLDNVVVFQAGTALRDGVLVTHGGRVLTVVGSGATYQDAIARAYEGVSRISFDGMHYRRDIGRKALQEM